MDAQSEEKIRLEELDQVMYGVNKAAGIRTPAAGARMLNIDDLQFYLHNRRREILGKDPHTPVQWIEEVR